MAPADGFHVAPGSKKVNLIENDSTLKNAAPRVSVVIPTYNCAAYLVDSIESVLNQTCQDFELIVVDDGSTDNTRQLLEPYRNRLIYLYQENQGESVARNIGIQLAQGEYIAFLDSDDLWLPNKLAHQIAVMDALPDAILSYSYSYLIDDKGERIQIGGRERIGHGRTGLYPVFERLVLGNFIANPGTVVVRKQPLLEAGGFDPAIRWGEDWDLWLRLAAMGPVAFIPQSLACYRIRHPKRRLQIEASDGFVRDNELILAKVFAGLSDKQARWKALRPHALAALYLRSALYNFELGDADRGSTYLALAVQATPALVNDGRRFARRVADEGYRIASKAGDIDQGLAFVDRVFDHLPPSAAVLLANRAYAKAELHMAAAFAQFTGDMRRDAWRQVAQAVCAYPPCLGNRGLISIGVQSLVGGKPWAKLRRADQEAAKP